MGIQMCVCVFPFLVSFNNVSAIIIHVILGIPVMRYDRAARPCALNFRLAALKCRFGRPPNALSSVGVMTFYAPTLCLFYPKRNNTNRAPIYRKKMWRIQTLLPVY